MVTSLQQSRKNPLLSMNSKKRMPPQLELLKLPSQTKESIDQYTLLNTPSYKWDESPLSAFKSRAAGTPLLLRRIASMTLFPMARDKHTGTAFPI